MTDYSKDIVTATPCYYMVVRGMGKIITSKVYGKVIEYAIEWMSMKGLTEIIALKTVYDESTHVKPNGTTWIFTGELRTDEYTSKQFQEKRRSPFYIWVEPFEWEAEYNPQKISDDLPF